MVLDNETGEEREMMAMAENNAAITTLKLVCNHQHASGNHITANGKDYPLVTDPADFEFATGDAAECFTSVNYNNGDFHGTGWTMDVTFKCFEVRKQLAPSPMVPLPEDHE